MTTTAPKAPAKCTICGKRFSKWPTRMWAIVCLANRQAVHHAGCRNGCDACVAAIGSKS